MSENRTAFPLACLEGWAKKFSEEGRKLWEEVQQAYLSFLNHGLDADEVARRWTLVVHLVNNFKLRPRIKVPAREWLTWPREASEAAMIPPTWPAPHGLQAWIIAQAKEPSFLEGGGFGWPKRSTLLSLVDPDSYAIIDRNAFTSLAGLTGGTSPVLGFRTSLGEQYEDDRKTRIPFPLSHEDYIDYMNALTGVRERGGGTLETYQRGLYSLGANLGSADRTWREYRNDLRIKLIGS